MNKISFEMAES